MDRLVIASLVCWAPLLTTGACFGLADWLGRVAGQPCQLWGIHIGGACAIAVGAAWFTLIFPFFITLFWLALGLRWLWRRWR